MGALDAVKNVLKSDVNWANTKKAASATVSAIGKAPFQAAALPFKGGAKLWKASPAVVKGAVALTAAIGVGAGLAAYGAASGRKDGTEFNPYEQEIADIPPILTPQDLMLHPMPQQASMQMGGEPDFPEMPHSRRVMADRGQGMGQEATPEMMAASQPNQSVISPENVRDLGDFSKTQAV